MSDDEDIVREGKRERQKERKYSQRNKRNKFLLIPHHVTSSKSQLAVAVVVLGLTQTWVTISLFWFLKLVLFPACVVFECLNACSTQKLDLCLIRFYRLIHRNSNSCFKKNPKRWIGPTTSLPFCVSLTRCFID